MDEPAQALDAWTCDCGTDDCPQCGRDWARQQPQPVGVVLPGGVVRYDDGTFDVPF